MFLNKQTQPNKTRPRIHFWQVVKVMPER